MRAAKNIERVNLSADIAVFGSSQGGQAVLLAGEIGKTYAPELHMESAVALAPASTLVVSPTGDEPELSSHIPLPYMIGVGFMDGYNVDYIFTSQGLQLPEAVQRKCVVEFYLDGYIARGREFRIHYWVGLIEWRRCSATMQV